MKPIVVLSAILGLLLLAAPAHAGFQLTLSDGVNPLVIVNDGDANDSNPVVGAITLVKSVGNWVTSVSTGLTKPVIGSAISPALDLNVVATSTGTGGTLTIRISDTGFGPLGSGLSADRTAVGGTTQGSVNVFGNIVTAEGFDWAKPGLEGLLPKSDGTFSGSALATLPPEILGASEFSMSLGVDITHGASGTRTKTTSLDATNDMVPEPATLAIWSLFGVVGVVFSWRRRRNVA